VCVDVCVCAYAELYELTARAREEVVRQERELIALRDRAAVGLSLRQAEELQGMQAELQQELVRARGQVVAARQREVKLRIQAKQGEAAAQVLEEELSVRKSGESQREKSVLSQWALRVRDSRLGELRAQQEVRLLQLQNEFLSATRDDQKRSIGTLYLSLSLLLCACPLTALCVCVCVCVCVRATASVAGAEGE